LWVWALAHLQLRFCLSAGFDVAFPCLCTARHLIQRPFLAFLNCAFLQVAAQALQAILPAWTGAGKSLQQLAEAVVAALPRVSPHRRLPLLSGLVAALPEVDGLCSVLALLLDTAVAQQAAAAAGDAQMAEADAAAAAAEEVEPAWAADLAADLMEQVWHPLLAPCVHSFSMRACPLAAPACLCSTHASFYCTAPQHACPAHFHARLFACMPALRERLMTSQT